MLEEEIEKLN